MHRARLCTVESATVLRSCQLTNLAMYGKRVILTEMQVEVGWFGTACDAR